MPGVRLLSHFQLGKETTPEGTDFITLTHPNASEAFRWVPTTNGNLPTGALRAGGESMKDGIYIARAMLGGSLCGGKFEPAHGCAYLSWGGKEHAVKQCEVLCITALDF